MSTLPFYSDLQAAYPAGTSSAQVKHDIGGAVDSAIVSNTCVVRVSRAFNYCGDKKYRIPKTDGLYTLTGADHFNYSLRVEEFESYLIDTYNDPDILKSGAAINKSAFAGKSGIICWRVNGWQDARGHFTIWDGTRGIFLGDPPHDYWSFPTTKPADGPWLEKVELWVC